MPDSEQGVSAIEHSARSSCGTAEDDADAVLARAVDAGATLERAAKDEFYGERSGVVRDPFGHRWLIGHAIEQVSPDEMQRRYDALFQ